MTMLEEHFRVFDCDLGNLEIILGEAEMMLLTTIAVKGPINLCLN